MTKTLKALVFAFQAMFLFVIRVFSWANQQKIQILENILIFWVKNSKKQAKIGEIGSRNFKHDFRKSTKAHTVNPRLSPLLPISPPSNKPPCSNTLKSNKPAPRLSPPQNDTKILSSKYMLYIVHFCLQRSSPKFSLVN